MRAASTEATQIGGGMRLLRSIFFLLCWGLAQAGYADTLDSCAAEPASSLVINVKDKGAAGNGVDDDTKALQQAIDQIPATGGIIVVPPGTYLVDAVTGIRLKSNVVLKLSDGANIKAAPNASSHYSILNITNASNVAVIGGTLVGERDEHKGTGGEWGMGITVRGSENVLVKNVTSRNNWGDGFYVGGKSRNVRFCAVVADGNRRQGLSITSGNGILVVDSTFQNTAGAKPQAGIVIEPNEGDSVSDVTIQRSRFLNNQGGGVGSFLAPRFKKAYIANLVIEQNLIAGNEVAGIALINTSGARVSNNVLKDNNGDAVLLGEGTRANVVSGNTIFRSADLGRQRIVDKGENLVSENQFR